MSIDLILYICALVCFAGKAVNLPVAVDLFALAFAFLTATLIVS